MRRVPFEDSYIPEPNSGCWLWLRYINRQGYGKVRRLGDVNRQFAHRVSYEMHVGQIPIGKCVLHKCDVPACVNPAHLFLGTHTDNMQDMLNKGRFRFLPGERNGLSKLTDDAVAGILISAGPNTMIAKRYGVSRSTVSLIRLGKRWRHVTGAAEPSDNKLEE